MGKFIAEQTIKQLAKSGKKINGARIVILGLTFKENCNDIRNTRVIDIIHELESYHVDVVVHDPLANVHEVEHEYGVSLSDWNAIRDMDAIILAVAHNFYLRMDINEIICKLSEPKLIVDVKSALNRTELLKYSVNVWCL
jgi:UDP-N-acetyl-D-mannosaminuronate dehydrogenase